MARFRWVEDKILGDEVERASLEKNFKEFPSIHNSLRFS